MALALSWSHVINPIQRATLTAISLANPHSAFRNQIIGRLQ
jgi:hypothetical protein